MHLKADCFASARNDVTSSLAPGGRGVGRGLGRGGNPLQNNVVTCPPLGGGPKSLISRRGKNALNSNQEPSPEFVSSLQLTNKFYPQLLHTDSHVSHQLNGSLCITGRESRKENVKNLVPQCPSALMPSEMNLFPFPFKFLIDFLSTLIDSE